MRRWLVAVLVPVLAGASLAQTNAPAFPEPAPPSPFDRVVTVQLGETFQYTAEFSGTLFVWPAWAQGDASLVLHVGDASDDGEGGVRTPCLQLQSDLDMRMMLMVSAAAGTPPGAIVEVHIVTAHETDATRGAAAAAVAETSAVAALREAGNLDEARRRITHCIDGLLEIDGAPHSEAVGGAAVTAAFESAALSLLEPTRAAQLFVLAQLQRRLPPDHPELQDARHQLGGTLFALGDFSGARALAEQVLAVRMRTRSPDDPDLQRARQNLAATLYMLGELSSARALSEQVHEVFARTLPADDPALQGARQNLAVMVKEFGDSKRARELEEQVLEVQSRTLPPDHPALQLARQNLAGTLKDLGELEGARELVELVLAARIRTLPPGHPDLIAARQNLATVMKVSGDLRGAQAIEEEVLADRERTRPAEDPDVQAARLNLAGTLKMLGDLQRARALEEEVLAVRTRILPADHPHLQMARMNLGGTLYLLGDHRGARDVFEAALEVLTRTRPAEDPVTQQAKLNLAVTVSMLGEDREARALFGEVLEVFARTLPADHPDLQRVRHNLAVTMKKVGDLHDAHALFLEVLAVRERTSPPDDPELQLTRANLLWTKALLRPHSGEGSEPEFAALARDHVRAVARSASSAWLAGSSREVDERLAQAIGDVSDALSFAQGLGVFAVDRELLRDAMLASESARGAAVLSVRFARAASGHPSHATLRASVAEARADVAAASHGNSDGAALHAALERRDAAERALLGLAFEPGASASDVREPVELEALVSALRAGESAVAFRRYTRWRVAAAEVRWSNDFVAFVLRGDGTWKWIDLGPVEPIAEAADRWRTTFAATDVRGRPPGHVQHAQPGAEFAGARLRQLVFDPVRAALGDTTDLVLVLDDVLHSIPFDALPLDTSLLGQRYHIENRVSLLERSWEARATVAPATGMLVAAGNVDFGGPAARFPALAATGLEANGIAALFGEDAIVFQGIDATCDAVTESAPHARFLHLATHGWFAPESVRSTADPEVIDEALGVMRQSTEARITGSSPMVLCGLALAGANLPPDELGRSPGLITAEEIAGWDLSNCELAVLSACDTNVGLRRAGQGVASLQKALHMAGARSVITSLWKVGDESTKDLMLDFYRRLWVEKKPKHQALWEAKMRIRDMKDETGAPKYATRDWAAWVLTGDPD